MSEAVELTTLAGANALMDLGDLGFENHYLGPSGYRGAFALSNVRRDAVAIFRPPIAASWNSALASPLELSRLWADARTVPLSAFVAAALKWIRRELPDVACVLAYTDPGVSNSITGKAHSGIVYRASNFSDCGLAPAAEPHWLDENGKRINRQAVVRLLGTGSKAAVTTARPGWRYVAGTRKRLFLYPMARSVADVLSALSAVPRSARTRPFGLAVEPPYRPWE
jgi:hypothetical protein